MGFVIPTPPLLSRGGGDAAAQQPLGVVALPFSLSADVHAAGDVLRSYPSTYGVFEEGLTELCDLIHEHGGQ